jgi:hypothetical protein
MCIPGCRWSKRRTNAADPFWQVNAGGGVIIRFDIPAPAPGKRPGPPACCLSTFNYGVSQKGELDCKGPLAPELAFRPLRAMWLDSH